MIDIVGPVGDDLCEGVPHPFEALIGTEDCLTIQWVVTNTPPGVGANDVIITSPKNLSTNIIVPIEGEYAFSVECCEAI